MDRPSLRQLEVFRAVARTESVSKAAERLFITQPAVSAQVRSLEKSLGLTLLEPAGRGVRLTGAGRAVFDASEPIFQSLDEFEQALAGYRGLETGALTIGASTTPGTYLLPPILGEFHRRYPGITLSLWIGDTEAVHRWLGEGRIHLGIVGSPIRDPRFHAQPWREDRIVLVASRNHPLGETRSISLDRLADEQFLLREQGSGTRRVVEEALPFRPRKAMELGSTEAIKQAVAAGLGLATLPECAIQNELRLHQIGLIDGEGFPLTRRFHVLRPRAGTIDGAVQVLLQMLRL